MINLIPTTEKNRLYGRYQKRFFIVLASLASIGFLAGAIFLVPSYQLAKEKTSAISNRLNIAQTISGAKMEGNPEFVAKDLEKKIDILSERKIKNPPSHLVGLILNSRPGGVGISGISYSQKDDGNAQFEIRGVAENRNSLLSLVRGLESEATFEKVNVPVSAFVKDRDLDFSIQIEAKI